MELGLSTSDLGMIAGTDEITLWPLLDKGVVGGGVVGGGVAGGGVDVKNLGKLLSKEVDNAASHRTRGFKITGFGELTFGKLADNLPKLRLLYRRVHFDTRESAFALLRSVTEANLCIQLENTPIS